MTRLLPLLLSVLFLLAPSARAQAMRPAPATTGPLIQQQPPSFPANPAHTPAGAGASHGGLATPGKALAPPSPNKRLLPPTKEAGLWAADGAPVGALSIGRVNVIGAVFEFGADFDTWHAAGECARDVNDGSSKITGLEEIAAKLSEGARNCIAARLLLHCATITKTELESGSRMYTRLRLAGAVGAERRAMALKEQHCGAKQLNYQQGDLLAAIQMAWGGVHHQRIQKEEGK